MANKLTKSTPVTKAVPAKATKSLPASVVGSGNAGQPFGSNTEVVPQIDLKVLASMIAKHQQPTIQQSIEGSSKVKSSSAVDSAINDLFETIETLYFHVSTLTEQLKPVSVPDSEEALVSGSGGPPVAYAPILANIYKATDRVKSINAVVVVATTNLVI